jgi:hypothetical protein
VPLEPGGAARPVRLADYREYVRAVEQFHLHECDTALADMRRGFMDVVPAEALAALSWSQLEELVAGKPDVDVAALRRHTDVRGHKADGNLIRWFWEVLEEFSPELRCAYLRFVWGRARPPATDDAWRSTDRHEIAASSAGPNSLPVTHTCSFCIELPAYTSRAQLQAKLTTAISFAGGILNC